MPKISVVMPAYNSEKYIAEAIESILNQTYTDFEFIIINDGSTDKTEEIILSYTDERIVYLKNEKNSGIVYTLNRGLDVAKGEYIARMDSDDISLPTRFEKQIKYFKKHPETAVLGTAINIFGEGTQKHTFKFSCNPQKAKAELFFSSCLAHPSVIIRKTIIDNHSLRYEEEYKGMEDFVLWWRISQYGDIISLKVPLLNYRKHSSQITASISPERIEKAKKFLLERIGIFNINLSDEEFDSLFRYRMGYYDTIKNADIKNLTSLFKKLLKNNKKIRYFNGYYFKKVLSLAIVYSISFLHCDEKEKFNYYNYAFKNNVLSFELFFKLLIHKIVKK